MDGGLEALARISSVKCGSWRGTSSGPEPEDGERDETVSWRTKGLVELLSTQAFLSLEICIKGIFSRLLTSTTDRETRV